MRHLIRAFALWFCLACPLWAEPKTVPVEVSEAIAHTPLGAGKVSVAYLTLKNQSDETYAVIAAQSDAFERAEMHDHLMEDGVMKMRQISQIDLPAGESVMLQSGGKHLMLIGAKQTIAVGDTITVQLMIRAAGGEAAQPLTINIPVQARKPLKPLKQDSHGG